MNYKRTVKNIRYSCFRRLHIKFLYNSEFDFTAKSLVTNTVVIRGSSVLIQFYAFLTCITATLEIDEVGLLLTPPRSLVLRRIYIIF